MISAAFRLDTFQHHIFLVFGLGTFLLILPTLIFPCQPLSIIWAMTRLLRSPPPILLPTGRLEGYSGTLGPDEKCNPSSESWACLGVSSQLDKPETLPQADFGGHRYQMHDSPRPAIMAHQRLLNSPQTVEVLPL